MSTASPDHGGARSFVDVRLVVAIVLAIPVVILSTVPAAQVDGWRWIALALATPAVLWCALDTHVSAAGGLLRSARGADVLTSIGILAAWVWSAYAVLAGRSDIQLAAACVLVVLIVTTRHMSAQAGIPAGDAPLPAWMLPVVLAVAAASLVVSSVVADPAAAISSAIAVVVGACPAAYALVRPLSLLSAQRQGKTLGVSLSGPDTLDACRRIDTIVLDKDGTVTTGKLTVTGVEPFDPDHDRNMRWFAAALEHTSEHPIAQAIARLAGRGRVTEVEHLTSLGISGLVDRHPVRVGHPGWIGVDSPVGLGTTVAVEVDGRALGRITVADDVRPTAREAIDALRALGIQPLVVSAGDLPDSAHLAEQLGLDDVVSGAGPDERLAVVEGLRAEGRVVAMVGDHSANAGALSAADLAVSPDSSTPGVPAGITVDTLDLTTVVGAIRLARTTVRRSDTSHRLALIGSLLPVPFASLGLLSPTYASLVAVACALAVTATILRKPPASA